MTVTALNKAQRARLRRREMGLMFQRPDLLPELNVEENVALTQLFDGVPRREALIAARASLEAVDMGRHAGKRIDEVSGGEAQRIALARGLARPGITLFVADEPTASLDAQTARMVTRYMVSRVRTLGVTALVATHDLHVADSCDRRVVIPETSGAGSTP